jgi:hypothetical protein
MIADRATRHWASLVFASAFASPLGAQDSVSAWAVQTDLQGLIYSYEDSAARDGLTNFGAFLHADYFERAGFTLGYNRTRLNAGRGLTDIDQDNFYLSGRFSMTPDTLPGRITLRLDGHDISNDDAIDGTDNVTAVAAQISYLNFARSFYWDIGYTRSTYADRTSGSSELEIDQFTPTVGIGLNDQRDWIQLRGYLIDASIPALALDQGSTSALELKWTHWPMNRGLLGLDNFRLSMLAGERLFAVDPDAGNLYNLSDLQTGSVSVGGEWRLSDRSRVLVLLGAETYENSALGQDYRGAFVYLNLSHSWE